MAYRAPEIPPNYQRTVFAALVGAYPFSTGQQYSRPGTQDLHPYYIMIE